MGIGAVVLIVVMFVISRVLKQLSGGMTSGTTVPRAPGSAPQTMAELFAEMQQQLEAAKRNEMAKRAPPGPTTVPRVTQRIAQRGGPKRLPAASAERGGSIEVASRDETVIVIDREDDIEAVVQRRIDAAAARNGEWQESDHARFDKKIREVAPAPAAAKPRSAIRQAMIWREVLGPPVALRQDDLP